MLITYIRRKLRERKQPQSTAQDDAQSTTPSRDQTVNNAGQDGQSLTWRLLLMVALIIPVFLETLDYTVVATAQVHIASIFNRLDLQSYIGTIYLLTSTVFLPPFASVADIFGRHKALQLSLAFFMVGSAISTGSHNMATMLAGRGVAGIGAAGLLAVVRIVLTDSRSLNANNWQQSIMFLLYTIGFCLGPFIGGELVTVSFRWIFAINLPCCAVAVVLAYFLMRGKVKGSQPPRRLPMTNNWDGMYETFLEKLLRIDWIGAAWFMVGGILILLALNWGSTDDWNTAKVIACFVIGGLAIIVFLLWEYYLERTEEGASTSKMNLLYTDPMIPLQLFKSLDVCVVMYATMISGMVMLVMFYFVAIFFVIVTGLSPTHAGTQLIYFAPGMGGGSYISIIMVKRLRQPRYPAILGALVSTIALGLISLGMNENKQNLVNGFMAMAGVGTGLQIGPLAVQARFSQPEENNAVVSALLLFFRALGGTIGLAQCGAVLNGKVSSYIGDMLKSGTLTAAQAQAISLASASSSTSSLDGINALPTELQDIVRDAFRQGSRYAFISLIPWVGLSFLVSLLMSNIRDTDRKPTVPENQIEGKERSDEEEPNKEQATPELYSAQYPPRAVV